VDYSVSPSLFLSLILAFFTYITLYCPNVLTQHTRYNQSSSCAVRSAVICYNLAHKFLFPASMLKEGENSLILSLPYNGSNYESALLPEAVYVQYDAMRLEVK
jgi:hypothetical protein